MTKVTDMAEIQALQQLIDQTFPGKFGVRLTRADADGVCGHVDTDDSHNTLPGMVHGGAIMALADTLGAYGAALNLSRGASTTTLESKTNFFARAPTGERLDGEALPLHRGKKTMVWQTRVTAGGKLVAMVTQTQVVLEARPGPVEQLAALFAARSAADSKALLAELEESAAGIYRNLAEQETDVAARQELLDAAQREEDNAAAMRRLLGT